MTTRKERRTLAFGHMSPRRKEHQLKPAEYLFGVESPVKRMARFELLSYRHRVENVNMCSYLYAGDKDEEEWVRQSIECLKLEKELLGLWEFTH